MLASTARVANHLPLDNREEAGGTKYRDPATGEEPSLSARKRDLTPYRPPTETGGGRESLVALRVLNGHAHRVANRPDRVEPRAVKRRPAPIALLTELRDAARARLIADTRT
jgi:hypothetical protein